MTTTITIRRSADASIAQALLNEFEVELATTRRFLERIPADKLSWKPHEKSMTAGQLALHIAELPAGVLQLALADTAEVPDFSAGRASRRSKSWKPGRPKSARL